MSTDLSSFTAKMDALRDKGFSDDEINSLLTMPSSSIQPQNRQQIESSIPINTGDVSAMLKSLPSPMAVTETMTDSDRAYAKEWNGHIEALSFFVGWKADVLKLCVWFFVSFPLVAEIFSGDPADSNMFVFWWMIICIFGFVVTGIYVKQKFILPHVKFLFQKRVD